jgi:hypothetical protein
MRFGRLLFLPTVLRRSRRRTAETLIAPPAISDLDPPPFAAVGPFSSRATRDSEAKGRALPAIMPVRLWEERPRRTGSRRTYPFLHIAPDEALRL